VDLNSSLTFYAHARVRPVAIVISAGKAESFIRDPSKRQRCETRTCRLEAEARGRMIEHRLADVFNLARVDKSDKCCSDTRSRRQSLRFATWLHQRRHARAYAICHARSSRGSVRDSAESRFAETILEYLLATFHAFRRNAIAMIHRAQLSRGERVARDRFDALALPAEVIGRIGNRGLPFARSLLLDRCRLTLINDRLLILKYASDKLFLLIKSYGSAA